MEAVDSATSKYFKVPPYGYIGESNRRQLIQIVAMEALQKSLTSIKQHAMEKSSIENSPKRYPLLLSASVYSLNKSRSKFVSVGLSSCAPFVPLLVLHGLKNDWIVFDEAEWNLLLENQGVISNFLYCDDGLQQTLSIGSKTAFFHTIGSTRVVTFRENGKSEVCIAFDSICELWDLICLVNVRITILKNLKFPDFYSSLVQGVAGLSMEYTAAIHAVLKDIQGLEEGAACMYEMLRNASHIVEADVEIAQRVMTFK